MTEDTTKKKVGRPQGSGTGRKRQVLSISLQPEERELLDDVTARYNVTQSALFGFILHNAWLLTVPAMELGKLRRTRQAGDD